MATQFNDINKGKFNFDAVSEIGTLAETLNHSQTIDNR